MAHFTQVILDGIITFGPWIMGLGFLISAAGLPIPVTPIVVAAGAAIEMSGSGSFSLILWGFGGIVAGDLLCYWLGWLAMEPIERLSPPWLQPMWIKMKAWIEHSGAAAIFFSRWLLNSVDVPLGLAAGGARFSFKQYAKSILGGRVLWFIFYGGLGFALGAEWHEFIEGMQAVQHWITMAALVLVGFYLLMKQLRKSLLPQLPEA